jgi:hypothetical protein
MFQSNMRNRNESLAQQQRSAALEAEERIEAEREASAIFTRGAVKEGSAGRAAEKAK